MFWNLPTLLPSLCCISFLLNNFKLIHSLFDFEELKELKYGIEITNKPVIFTQSQDSLQSVMHLASKYGQTYQCVVPVKDLKSHNPESQNKSLTSNVTVTSILDEALNDQCLIYLKGWWTYKLCYKKEITQFHEGENGLVSGDVISLGVFESEKRWNETELTSKTDSYHSQKFTNGSICELIGKPRQSLVKFFCDEETTSTIVSVDEPATCVYSISVHSKALCAHPRFKPPKKEKPKEITCSPALSQDQYDQYMKKEQEAQRKKQEEEKKRLDALSKLQMGDQDAVSIPGLFNTFLNVGKEIGKKFEAKKSTADVKDKSAADPAKKLEAAAKELVGELERKSEEAVEALKRNLGDLVSPNDVDEEASAQANAEDAGKSTKENEKAIAASKQEANTAPVESTSETAKALVDNKMSKAENKLSSKGEFLERRNSADSQKEITTGNKVQQLISLKKRIEEIDKQTELLNKKDREMRMAFQKQFAKTKKISTKQISGFKSLLQRLKNKKAHAKTDKVVQLIDKLIQRVDRNIKIYEQKLKELDARMAAMFGENFANQAEVLFGEKPVDGSDTQKDKQRNKIGTVLKDLFKKSDNDADRIVQAGKELESDETKNEAEAEEMGSNEKPGKDPLLDALIKMMQLGGKKIAKKNAESNDRSPLSADKDENQKAELGETEDKSVKEPEDTNKVPVTESVSESKTAAESNEESKESGSDNKVKVKITRLDSGDVKVLEEHEKQEQLAGTATDSGRMNNAAKKIENMIKKKLEKAGVDVGAKIKIKIITNDAQMSKFDKDGDTSFLTDDTANKFKDLLVNLLGGGAEKIKEEKRQSSLENNYKFSWIEDKNNEEQKERTNNDDQKATLL